MSLEAIETVMRTERAGQERRSAAETEAKQLIAEAERGGHALLESVKTEAAAERKRLLEQAEQSASKRAAKITADAKQSAANLRKTAEKHLTEAADFIVGRVVE